MSIQLLTDSDEDTHSQPLPESPVFAMSIQQVEVEPSQNAAPEVVEGNSNPTDCESQQNDGRQTHDSPMPGSHTYENEDLSVNAASIQCTGSGPLKMALDQRTNDGSHHDFCTDDLHLDEEDIGSAAFVDSFARQFPLAGQNRGSYQSGFQTHRERYSLRHNSFESAPGSYKSLPSGSPVSKGTPKRGMLDLHGHQLMNGPVKFVDSPSISSKELLKAYNLVHQVIKDNPRAFGTVLLAHHQDAPSSVELSSLCGIEKGTDKLYDAFTALGLAVVRLKNPSTEYFKAVMKVMASHEHQLSDPLYNIKYPASYKYFFFYTTGHGARRAFFTKDCAIAYSTVYDQFQGLFEQRYFFFDCCRDILVDDISLFQDQTGTSELPDIPGNNGCIKAGNKIVFATLDCKTSWGPGGGVSYMTEEMILLLQENLSIDEMISRLKAKLPVKHQQPMLVDTAPDVNLMELRNQSMKPRLEQQPSISPDGSVAHFLGTLAPPLVKSESFEVESVAIITKSGKDSWENLEERTVHTESIMIPQQQPSDRRSRSRSTHVSETQPLTGAASSERASLTFSIGEEALNPPSLPLRVPKIVSLPVQRTDTSEARMVVKYKGGMKTESASLFFPVPSLATPTIEKACLRGGFCHGHMLFVTWTTYPDPSIPNENFSVEVYTSDGLLHAEPVTVTINNGRPCERYSCRITLPSYQDKETYAVIVTATRSDCKHVSSERFTARKGCCHAGQWRSVAKLILFLLLVAVVLIPIVLLIFNATKISHHCTFNASDTTSYTVFEPQSVRNEEKCMFQSCFLCEPDLCQPTLNKFANEDTQQVYCAQFPRLELANSQSNKFLSPDDIGIDQTNATLYSDTHFLPLGPGSTPFGVYLLPNSVFSVFLCLAETVVHSVEVLLFEYNDWTHLSDAQPLANLSVLFDRSLCSNTTVAISEAVLVVPALSSRSNVKFKAVKGYVNQYYYDQTVQKQLLNATNLIKRGESIQKKGSGSTKLLCYIEGGQQGEVFSGLISIAISFSWKAWTLPTLTPLPFLLLVVTVVTVVIYCAYKQHKLQSHRRRTDYEELVNPSTKET